MLRNVNVQGGDNVYTVWRLLGCDVLLCFLSKVPVTIWATQKILFQTNGQWNISKMLYKIS